ncbi:MAG: integrase [Actinobacteria bacterium]|nr:integrase [Actinomycetota bacterium]
MPKAADQPAWVTSLRDGIKASAPSGWLVSNDHGRIRLEVHDPAVGKKQSVGLPFRWHQDDWADALARVREIIAAYKTGGLSLKAAADFGQKVSSYQEDDWAAALQRFEAYKVPDQITDRTFRSKYLPALKPAVMLLTGRSAPADGKDLCEQVLRPWKGKDTMHRHMWQALTQFLNYCVDELDFKAMWRPPAKRVARAKKTDAKGSKRQKKIAGYPLTDAQILRLLDALPDDEAGSRWRFAFQLMAVYGLRPEDLRYLHTRNGGEELWSNYEKSKGGIAGDCTEPRMLHPLMVHDLDGPQQWNLRQRVHLREALPPLGAEGHAGEACGTFLRRQKVWQSLKQEVAMEGQKLVPYSFRHRYSYVAHTRSLADGSYRTPKQIADAMGHDLETHLHSYSRFATRDLKAAFDDDAAIPPVRASSTS